MKFATTILGAALGAFLSLSVSAAPIPLPPGFLQLSDNDAEYLINSDGTRCGHPVGGVGGDCTVDQGDRLRGIFDINSIEGLLPPTAADFTPFNGYELTAIFDITVDTKTGAPGAWTFNFKPTGNLDLFGSGIVLHYDTTHDYTRLGCTDVSICEATATGGPVWAGFGFGPGSYWIAQAPTDNIADIGAIPPPTQVGGYNAALDFTVNNTGYTFLPHQCLIPFLANDMADACASGGLLGVGDGTDTPFDSFSNVDFTLRRAVVPEPASLALLGLGLALVGFARRKFS